MRLGVPQAPSNVEISSQTPESVTLAWGKPKNDGGSKITAYQVEVRRPDSDVWEVANNYPIKGNDFTVENLQTGKPYEFRVKAKNAAGWSDYSKLDRPVTLKPDSGRFCCCCSWPGDVRCIFSCALLAKHA
jgi:titin